MEADENVFVMGEDIAKLGGVFGTTTGLLDKFGSERVRDTPISETAFIGAAMAGMRPIVELIFVDFSVFVWMQSIILLQKIVIFLVVRNLFLWC